MGLDMIKVRSAVECRVVPVELFQPSDLSVSIDSAQSENLEHTSWWRDIQPWWFGSCIWSAPHTRGQNESTIKKTLLGLLSWSNQIYSYDRNVETYICFRQLVANQIVFSSKNFLQTV